MSAVDPGADFEVCIEKLSRSFIEGDRQHHVLRNLSIAVARGEIVALRGRSGSGKSTLLNVISGIDCADSGDVEVAGLNITQISERDRTLFRRKNIGFVYQSFNLIPTLSVKDNVKLVLELNGTAGTSAETRTCEMLEAVGLGGRAGSYPDVLSGGEQQRVAIARALVHEPALVLADEPTGNLDAETAAGILNLLAEMLDRSSGTMLIATHSATVASRCDRVLHLRNGVLDSDAQKGDLRAN